MSTLSQWIRTIYLYLVCIITMVICIIGCVTIINLVIRTYAFGIHGSWYQSPHDSCEYILTNDASTDVHLRTPKPDTVSTGNISAMSREEQEASYAACLKREEKEIKQRERYDFADSMSTGISMILVALPLFLFHWKYIQKKELS